MQSRAGKTCFVTTGATAPFTALIEAVLSEETINVFLDCDISHLVVQYGTAQNIYETHAKTAIEYLNQKNWVGRISIEGVGFYSGGLSEPYALVAKSEGFVISHGGAGSIIEALRFQFPLIAVPNSTLLDNHQDELVDALDKKHYLIRGDVNNLAPAIKATGQFRTAMSQKSPMTAGKSAREKSFAQVMDETVGYSDLTLE